MIANILTHTKKVSDATIIASTEICKDTYEIIIDIKDTDFSFTPGQYLWWVLPEMKYKDERGNRRAFSIVASAADEKGKVRCLFRASESGFKKTLIEMPMGSTITVEGPFGFCTLPSHGAMPVVFVVGGVGIASVYTMIHHSLIFTPERRIVLIYANEHSKCSAYAEELRTLQKNNKNFSFIEKVGQITIADISDHTKDMVDPTYYIFGPEAMVFATGTMLMNKHVSIDKIISEEFRFSGASLSKSLSEVLNTTPGFKMALDNAFNHIILTDMEGYIVYANHGAEIVTGYSAKEMVGSTPRLWGGLMTEDFYVSMWKTIKEEKKIFAGEMTNRRKNGEIYVARAQISPFIDPKTGALIGFVGTEEDITRDKEIDQMKTDFVSIASHQLRTPLTPIRLFSEMLLDEKNGSLNPRQKDYIETIRESTKRMISLVNDLLNISRLETGRLKIDKTSVDIVTFIQDCINEVLPVCEIKGCKVIFNKSEINKNAANNIKVGMDPVLMRQVVHNLLTNAIRYSPAQGANIEVKLATDVEAYIVSVRDEGIGIPKEAKGRIFEKFYRADNAKSVESEGSGLGMYTAKMVVEASGGEIWFESPPKGYDRGTEFSLRIPNLS